MGGGFNLNVTIMTQFPQSCRLALVMTLLAYNPFDPRKPNAVSHEVNARNPTTILDDWQISPRQMQLNLARTSQLLMQLRAEAGLASLQSKENDEMAVAQFSKEYESIIDDMREVFDSGRTKDLAWRRGQLEGLIQGIQQNIDAITEALAADLGADKTRALFDMGPSIADAQHAIKNLERWTKPTKIPNDTPFEFGKSVYVRPEPKGIVLNIGPWNYPFNLCFQPLVAAIAAGNCMLIKPSEQAPRSAAVIERIVQDFLDNDCVKVVQGAIPETTALLEQQWDHIFYTGNGFVGRIVMQAAAKHLTPVTLELGGKNPAIVDKTANLATAVNRIFAAKTSNQGQICVAPDFVIIDETREDEFVTEFVNQVRASNFGEGSKNNERWGKIITERHTERLKRLIDTSGGEVMCGGSADVDVLARHVPMTVIKNISRDAPVLQEEIFGPILPIVPVSDMRDGLKMVKCLEHPLALYIFSEDEDFQESVLQQCTSGGAAVNTAMEQLMSKDAPFGGVGGSGMGRYHGKYGFDEFSHLRTVVYKKGSDPFLPHVENQPKFLYDILRKVLVGA